MKQAKVFRLGNKYIVPVPPSAFTYEWENTSVEKRVMEPSNENLILSESGMLFKESMWDKNKIIIYCNKGEADQKAFNDFFESKGLRPAEFVLTKSQFMNLLRKKVDILYGDKECLDFWEYQASIRESDRGWPETEGVKAQSQFGRFYVKFSMNV